VCPSIQLTERIEFSIAQFKQPFVAIHATQFAAQPGGVSVGADLLERSQALPKVGRVRPKDTTQPPCLGFHDAHARPGGGGEDSLDRRKWDGMRAVCADSESVLDVMDAIGIAGVAADEVRHAIEVEVEDARQGGHRMVAGELADDLPGNLPPALEELILATISRPVDRAEGSLQTVARGRALGLEPSGARPVDR